ncbi:MAG TPA: hypothetical protein VNX28_16780 [Gemmataceae bacterium]|nr:hypothetical protein [Gemmataceae bacterium]
MAKLDAESLAAQVLASALADPGPKALFGTKTKPGIFIGTTQINKQAAQLCLDRGWLAPTGQFEGKGKSAKESYRITATGARQALEKSEPVALLKGGMEALKQLADLKPKIEAALTGLETQHHVMASLLDRLHPPDLSNLTRAASPPSAADVWVATALTYLGDYQKAHPYGMCPLPELFAHVARPRGLSIGSFHDGLRQLVHEGRVRLHPYTGAAYTLENEQYALVAGQEIKFYAQRIDGT